jgi:hypothetical protein
MQLAVLVGPPGARRGRIIIGQELLVVAGGQHTHDLHRVTRIEPLHWVRNAKAHGPRIGCAAG